ncbi:aryl-sulfate sulfotransferase [Natrinema marinum]|uniref:aryl-sulfate sulfotransferase n=1 Tax=Natrinema marinum TaxID=2961598 RepID=UPI0020C8D53E|nr:aryl-sulfate sulfotransferase [Natrinema marinum]
MLVSQLAFLGIAFATATADYNERYAEPIDAGSDVDWSNVTVVTAQQIADTGTGGQLFATTDGGETVYYDDRFATYWDVDPVPGTRATVVVATEHPATCDGCRRNVVERVNLSTGERTRLHSHRAEEGRWHDVDLIGTDELLVADFDDDAVVRVNASSGIRTWSWQVEAAFPIESGGSYDGDWAHLNDVELLPDGRVMASLRNHDRVVFLNESGVMPSWTLGDEDDHDVLYEQHNPDYVPASHGGPAVLVADSENDRIVEYQRRDGEWVQSWEFTHPTVAWPRDADRLPNGHTLVTSSTGDRVFEIDTDGEIVRSLTVDLPYEAERLGTPPESGGGEAAAALKLSSSRATERGDSGSVQPLVSVVPSRIRNGLLFVLPPWVGGTETAAVVGTIGLSIAWAILEWHWRDPTVSVTWPIRIRW